MIIVTVDKAVKMVAPQGVLVSLAVTMQQLQPHIMMITPLAIPVQLTLQILVEWKVIQVYPIETATCSQ